MFAKKLPQDQQFQDDRSDFPFVFLSISTLECSFQWQNRSVQTNARPIRAKARQIPANGVALPGSLGNKTKRSLERRFSALQRPQRFAAKSPAGRRPPGIDRARARHMRRARLREGLAILDKPDSGAGKRGRDAFLRQGYIGKQGAVAAQSAGQTQIARLGQLFSPVHSAWDHAGPLPPMHMRGNCGKPRPSHRHDMPLPCSFIIVECP